MNGERAWPPQQRGRDTRLQEEEEEGDYEENAEKQITSVTVKDEGRTAKLGECLFQLLSCGCSDCLLQGNGDGWT